LPFQFLFIGSGSTSAINAFFNQIERIMITTHAKITPVLDPGFVPAVLWNRAFEKKTATDPGAHDLHIALTRKDGTVFRRSLRILSHQQENAAILSKRNTPSRQPTTNAPLYRTHPRIVLTITSAASSFET
jgi:hypothetical protein